MKAETLGRIRIYWLAFVACLGGFLFGYDSGIVGKLEAFSIDCSVSDCSVRLIYMPNEQAAF